MSWTDKQTQAAIKNCRDGLSASQNADNLNRRFKTSFTRNSVIGRLHRSGFAATHKSPRVKPTLATTRTTPSLPPSPIDDAPTDAPTDAPFEPIDDGPGEAPADTQSPLEPVALLERSKNGCCWPMGRSEKGQRLFCNAPKKTGTDYCAAHWARGHQPQAAGEKTRGQPRCAADARRWNTKYGQSTNEATHG